MGSFREVLGSGTFLGFPVFGDSFEPWIIMILPPGGFLTLGFVLLFFNWLEKRRKERAALSELPEGIGTQEVV